WIHHLVPDFVQAHSLSACLTEAPAAKKRLPAKTYESTRKAAKQPLFQVFSGALSVLLEKSLLRPTSRQAPPRAPARASPPRPSRPLSRPARAPNRAPACGTPRCGGRPAWPVAAARS